MLETHISPQDIVNILSQVQLFSELRKNEQALQKLAALMSVKTFQEGHVLIEEGALGAEFFILLEGSVSIYKKTPDGDAYKVAILKADSHPALGEGGLVEGELRSASVICDSACRFLVLTKEQFARFCLEEPGWAVPVLQKLCGLLMGRVRQLGHDLVLLHKALMSEIRN